MVDNRAILNLLSHPPKPIKTNVFLEKLPENPTVGNIVYNPDNSAMYIYNGSGFELLYTIPASDICVPYDYDKPKKIIYGELECTKCGATIETSGEDEIKCPYCGTVYYNKDKYVMAD